MSSSRAKRKAPPAPASRAMIILAPPSLFGLRGRSRFFLLRLVELPPLVEDDLGKAKSPVLPFVPSSTSDMVLSNMNAVVIAWLGCMLVARCSNFEYRADQKNCDLDNGCCCCWLLRAKK